MTTCLRGLGVVALAAVLAATSLRAVPARAARADRQVIRLDGTWQIAEGSMDKIPQTFAHRIAVPGLVDMAQPAFDQVGRRSGQREAFWYRRTFTVNGPVPPIAVLKIRKAKYGTKVFLNGTMIGEHLPCFTPALLDVQKQLKGSGQRNELVIRVGASRESLPQDMPTGWDFEKYLFIPGIYDSVDLILTGSPQISNIQTVPDISAGRVRVIAEVRSTTKPSPLTLKGQVVEVASGAVVGTEASSQTGPGPGQTQTISLAVPIQNCRLWSPEDPFLYRLTLHTEGDSLSVRFGMREFRFDPQTKRAMLNGRPYFLRGTNVCAYRFFEDEARADRPWRADWVRRLHRKFKSMHWNAIRYCIGFPPEIWYEIADEEGFLIQDEFPIWLLGKAPENPKAEKIIPQYTEWMRERWNHPCVVIWDAQNESITPETGKALQAVRGLDLSQRPWENGWAAPQSATDCVEAHPYLFIKAWQNQPPFRLKDLAGVSGVPQLRKAQRARDVPIIINEYGWLWLDRSGRPTCLTEKVYEALLGPQSTVDQRRVLYARYLAALTEFWRCHRQCAGVLHFCGLGYSRAGDKPRPEGGATSDHFLDLETLSFEPHFEQYVRDAFSPVGLMLDFWEEEQSCGQTRPLRVFVINDLYEDWRGTVTLKTMQAGRCVRAKSVPCSVASLGKEVLPITDTVPDQPGDYTLIAELTDPSGRVVRSLRDFRGKRPD
jgi:beta-galactosidase